MAEDIGKLKYRINYEFKNRELLRKALTHRSYAVEHNLHIICNTTTSGWSFSVTR